MTGRLRSVDTHRRTALVEGWSLCASAPGAWPGSMECAAADADWIAIDRLDTVAAALAVGGHWSLDGPERRFDAQDWWFRLRFDAPPRQGDERWVLGFDGLATVAEAWLNGECLLRSENMFVAHEVDLGQRLLDHNELLIVCRSLDARLAARRPRPRWRTPMVEHQQLRWWRTTLLGRTPGWSPPAAPVGPWRPVWLERRSALQIDALHLRPTVHDRTGRIDIDVDLLPLGQDRIESVALVVSRRGRSHETVLHRRGATWHGSLTIENVDLWWPHTHGEPALYDARLRIVTAGRSAPILADLGPIGFRTLRIDTANGDFAWHINDVPLFCRGACWSPVDVLRLRGTAENCHSAVAQAAAAGMNMLRVSGTMTYEDEAFLDACDALGVLVWQDLMFANMDYPADDEAFLASVRTEVGQQLQRWQGRPSLGLVCGNSEVEQQAAMWGAPREQWAPRLFHDTLAALCAQTLPDTLYWPSSAHGGAIPHEPARGTTSSYGVGAYLRPLDDARRAAPRFASECLAFANVPSAATVARMPQGQSLRPHWPAWKARVPRDLGAGWDFDDVRDHYLQRLFGVDPVALRSVDVERYWALSRAATGEVMAATMSEWRRAGSRCRGALVLMLRDLWAGAGWGLVDDCGRPKAAFHALRRVLQPMSMALTDEGLSGLQLHWHNEHPQTVRARLDVAIWREGGVLVERVTREIQLAGRGSGSHAVNEFFDRFVDLNHAYRFGPLAHQAVVATLRDAVDGQILAQQFHFPAGHGLPMERELGLEATVTSEPGGGFALTVRTQLLAQGVHFELPAHVAEDEYFHLEPGQERRLHLASLNVNGAPPVGQVRALNGQGGRPIRVLS